MATTWPALPPEHRPVRTVFQSYALFPHMTVSGNIAFPLKMAKTPAREIAGKVAEALEDVRLTGFGNRFPHELSGGQRQRVAIARALVTHPTVLLLDEPLAALDAKLREEMQIELINMQKEVGITFVYVTHDQTEALALSHRIAVMNKGRGGAGRRAGPAVRPAADALRGRLHRHLQPARRTGDRAGGRRGDPWRARPRPREGDDAGRPLAGREGAVALRPEKVRISPPDGARNADNHFSGVVTSLLYQGDVTVYMVRCSAGHVIEALLANSSAGLAKFFEIGDAVEISWSADAGHYVG